MPKRKKQSLDGNTSHRLCSLSLSPSPATGSHLLLFLCNWGQKQQVGRKGCQWFCSASGGREHCGKAVTFGTGKVQYKMEASTHCGGEGEGSRGIPVAQNQGCPGWALPRRNGGISLSLRYKSLSTISLENTSKVHLTYFSVSNPTLLKSHPPHLLPLLAACWLLWSHCLVVTSLYSTAFGGFIAYIKNPQFQRISPSLHRSQLLFSSFNGI